MSLPELPSLDSLDNVIPKKDPPKENIDESLNIDSQLEEDDDDNLPILTDDELGNDYTIDPKASDYDPTKDPYSPEFIEPENVDTLEDEDISPPIPEVKTKKKQIKKSPSQNKGSVFIEYVNNIIKNIKSKINHNKTNKDSEPSVKKTDVNKSKKILSKLPFNPLYIVISVVAAIFILFMLSLFLNHNSQPSKKVSQQTTQSKSSKNDISIKSTKDEYNGVSFSFTSPINQKINIQRVYKDKSNNLVLCETGTIEVYSGKTNEAFAECLNNENEVKNTKGKTTIDNINYIESQE